MKDVAWRQVDEYIAHQKEVVTAKQTHFDFALFNQWCNQNKKKASDANVLNEFMSGLPLYHDGFGDLYLDGEIDVAYSLKYGAVYNVTAHEQSNMTIGECLLEEVHHE